MARDRAELRTLAIALLASLLLWNLPYGGFLLYPFKILATWLHELSHCVVMLVTGAGVRHVIIYRDTSGESLQIYKLDDAGTAAIAAAGYMGTPLWGAVLLLVTPSPRAARVALLALAAAMVASAFTAIIPAPPPDGAFGIYATLAIAGALAACALALPGRWRVLGAHFIAAQACVNALLDIRVLLRPYQTVGGGFGHSDAQVMAAATFGTTDGWAIWTWAVIWLAWSLAVLYFTLIVASRSVNKPAAERAIVSGI